jgi:hypothetical protein
VATTVTTFCDLTNGWTKAYLGYLINNLAFGSLTDFGFRLKIKFNLEQTTAPTNDP